MRNPNIIFIVVDDLGWSDLACYGSQFYETPNLDRLAGDGISFTEAYASSPICSPSRASILTGKYPVRNGVTDWIDWGGRIHPCRGRLIDAPYTDHLSPEESNVASILKSHGYATWHVGKWHLGGEEYYPERQGFDVNIGGCSIGMPRNGYFSPYNIPTIKDGPTGEYLTDRLTDEAINLIKNHDDKPFFLNIWYYSVHIPIQAKTEYIRKFEKKSRIMGLDGKEAFKEGNFYPSEHKHHQRIIRRIIQSNPVYAAMIYSLDENIGRLLDGVDEIGETDNTIVVFTSDNGGLSTAEGSPTCNVPLREGKGWLYEGGIRVPLILKWPSTIECNKSCSIPVISTDFYPTILDILGLDLGSEQDYDGVSLLPILEGHEHLDRKMLFWHYPHYGNQGGTPSSSVRCGDYKILERFEDGTIELYHLKKDIGEETNLAEDDYDLALDLKETLLSWRNEVNAKIPAVNKTLRKI